MKVRICNKKLRALAVAKKVLESFPTFFYLRAVPRPWVAAAAASAAGVLMSSPFAQQPRITAEPDQSDFPKLLDDEQWTQAATFAQTDRFTGPSQRIGRYYQQRLDELSIEGLQHKQAERTAPASPLRPTIERKGWAAGLPQRALLDPLSATASEGLPPMPPPADLSGSALGILRFQREQAVQKEALPHAGTFRHAHVNDKATLQQRMAAYVERGIDPSSLAPFNDAWMDSAMEQVPTELAGVEPDRVDEMVYNMVDEVHQGYYDGVKLSMVEVSSHGDHVRPLGPTAACCTAREPAPPPSQRRSRASASALHPPRSLSPSRRSLYPVPCTLSSDRARRSARPRSMCSSRARRAAVSRSPSRPPSSSSRHSTRRRTHRWLSVPRPRHATHSLSDRGTMGCSRATSPSSATSSSTTVRGRAAACCVRAASVLRARPEPEAGVYSLTHSLTYLIHYLLTPDELLLAPNPD